MESINNIIDCIVSISKIPKNELLDDTKIYESNVLSSLQMLELISELEKKFNISIEPEDLIADNFEDINSINKFVKLKINE